MRRRVLALIALVSALGATSCGLLQEMSGIIGEWRGAPSNAHSTVFLHAADRFPDRELVALDGVEVLLKTGADPTSDRRAAWSRAQTTSDAGGHFSLGASVFGGGPPHARVTSRKPGFEPVEVKTSETRLDQVVVALVREQ